MAEQSCYIVRHSVALVLLILGSLSAEASWRLTWNDEFSGAIIDEHKWSFDVGTGPPYPGWGNRELQYYTSRTQNAFVTNGMLNIAAREEPFMGSQYTSARLKTKGLFEQLHGRFEFRARLPQGKGYWPALWLLPAENVYGTWAASGEIDVMEAKGHETAKVHGTLHYGGTWPHNTNSGDDYVFPNNGSITDFHVYALEWTSNSFKWFVDGVQYQTQTSWWSSSNQTNTSIRNPYPAPFDQPFHLIMNLAVGGNYPGSPDSTTLFPGVMQVDYVRVYQWSTEPIEPVRFSKVSQKEDNLLLSGSKGIPHAPFYLLRSDSLKGNSPDWLPASTNWFDDQGRFTVEARIESTGGFYRIEVP